MSESHLFYQTVSRRPRIARAEGIYLWDTSGKRYIDASSGPMVSNIGHSNPRVLAAMKKQMDSATFAYRLHFENDAAESLAALTASLMPDGLDRIFFVSGGSECVESCLKLARQYAFINGQPETLESHLPVSVVSRLNAGCCRRNRHAPVRRAISRNDQGDA